MFTFINKLHIWVNRNCSISSTPLWFTYNYNLNTLHYNQTISQSLTKLMAFALYFFGNVEFRSSLRQLAAFLALKSTLFINKFKNFSISTSNDFTISVLLLFSPVGNLDRKIMNCTTCNTNTTHNSRIQYVINFCCNTFACIKPIYWCSTTLSDSN